jgi:hypothetical protein
MPRKRGERNWEDMTGDYELHVPIKTIIPSDDLEHTNKESGLVWIHGVPYIRAIDGKLEPVDE